MKANHSGIETKVIHAGEPRPRIAGAVVMPVFQSATYQYAGEKSYDEVRYIRLNNTPNHLALAQKLAALENTEDALVTASGMAAISTSLLTFLGKGDHLLAQDCLYGGTHDFVTKDIEKFGISYDFIDGNDPESWKRKLKPTTRAIYVETISNPLMQVPDLESIVSFAKSHGLVSMIDNTFASPVNFRPSELGFDLSLHIGKTALIQKVTHKLNHLGGSLDPHAAFLLHRGIKTLALRVKHHNESALQIARFLEKHPAVAKVNYPGLESHPNHERAQRLFDGFGGMMSFELHDGVEGAESFMRAVLLPAVAPSLGGVETLVTRPSTTSHSGLSAEDRRRLGISDGLIRLSVGIEATQDLMEDFRQALETQPNRTSSHRSEEGVQVHE
jgi:cystathionine beta-lyase/cystathionine gamma-synthase